MRTSAENNMIAWKSFYDEHWVNSVIELGVGRRNVVIMLF